MKRHLASLLLMVAAAAGAQAAPPSWQREFSTDFTKHSVPLEQILEGGPPKDGIPAIDDPAFKPVVEVEALAPTEPVIGVSLGGESKAYPIRILMRHEIVNDTIGGVPVAVTFCPLCNAALVFDRRLDDKVLDFGTTGRLRNSDLVMYDRQTESWWQQFLGEAIVGELTGRRLELVPARLESWENFKQRAPDGMVLRPTNERDLGDYGFNPYTLYDSRSQPYPSFLQVRMPDGVPAMMRVVSLADRAEAWSLPLLREKGEIRTKEGVVLTWTEGQASALDKPIIAAGREVGNVTAWRETPQGPVDVPYAVDFAFAFHAFHPDRPIHVLPE